MYILNPASPPGASRCLAAHNPGTTPCDERNWRYAWFFHQTRKRCEAFRFNGCGPAENNFVTRALCESVCKDFSESFLVLIS